MSLDGRLSTPRLAPRCIHTVRVRGGNKKYRALRLDVGNFSWGSECCTRKTRIIDVIYNASNNELVRTKTLVKNCIVLIDSAPYRQWYESHYALPLGRKKGAQLTPGKEEILNKKRSRKFKRNTMKGKRTPKLAVFWMSSSSRASFSPVLPQDQASVAEQMAMCSKAKSLSSI
ncbi:40S ribosomal protein S8 [Sigmodon hispidus]